MVCHSIYRLNSRLVILLFQVHLLPDGNTVHQTKLHRRTLSPIYDERFEVKLSPCTPEHQLHFGVFDFDRYSRHDLIGTAVLQLDSPDVTTETLHVLDLVINQVFYTYFRKSYVNIQISNNLHLVL